MKNRGFTKRLFFLTIAAFFALTMNANAQTVLVNYDFANAVAGTPCTATPLTSATGVTSTFTTSTGTCTTPAGAATTTTPAPFVANASNQSVSISGFNPGFTGYFQFQLSGVSSYQNYMLYFQNQRSGSGPVNFDIQYSTDGTNFTTFQSFTSATALSTGGVSVDLSAVSAIEGQANVYFRIVGRDGTSTTNAGTFRIDNFQVQAALAPTAAQAQISGRVLVGRRAVSKVSVMLSGGDLEEPIYATTDFNGNYKFENLAVGETYLLQVMTSRYRFNNPNIVVSLMDNITDANFIASGK